MLDIIIPVYNNKRGLEETLNSINPSILSDVKITIIDDCSTESYDRETLRLSKNSGPGAARQYGIDHTSEPYIMFIDAGDTFTNNEIQKEMIEKINNMNAVFISYYYNKINKDGSIKILNNNTNRLHGKIYQRAFINKYNIKFCIDPMGSYADEDIGFNFIYRNLLEEKKLKDKIIYLTKPIINWNYDPNSITRQRNCEIFNYEKQLPGIITNTIHAEKILSENYCSSEICAKLIYKILGRIYFDFIRIVKFKPDLIEKSWKMCKQYYINIVIKYESMHIDNYDTQAMQFLAKEIKKWDPPIPKINYRAFVEELKTAKTVPQKYFMNV